MEDDIKTLKDYLDGYSRDIGTRVFNNAIENVLKELELAKEALKDKCEVADERNNLLVENQKLNKVIDEIAEFMSYDYCIPTIEEECQISKATPEKCVGCIKRFFMKKVEEQE